MFPFKAQLIFTAIPFSVNFLVAFLFLFIYFSMTYIIVEIQILNCNPRPEVKLLMDLYYR